MTIKKFEKLDVWEEARNLTLEVYDEFEENKDFGFRGQIQKAAVSIMNNIAEGFERKSNKEFKRFLYIAKGSSGEVRSMLYLALEIGYISEDKFDSLSEQTIKISKMLSGLIKSLE